MAAKGRGQAVKSGSSYFIDGLIIGPGGLAKLLGCKSTRIAGEIARQTVGFPPERIFGRGTQGWSRLEVEAWLLNPTAPAVDNELAAVRPRPAGG